MKYLACVWKRLWPMVLGIGLYVLLSIIGVVGAIVLNSIADAPPNVPIEQVKWPENWARFDAWFYLEIASNGYRVSSRTPAFYPLYPLLIRVVSLTGLESMAAGTLLSALLTAGTFTVLYHAVAIDFGKAVGRDTVIALSLFPTAFFLYAVYTEALFLFLSVAAYYLARQRYWGAAAVVCLLASLTRDNGVLGQWRFGLCARFS